MDDLSDVFSQAFVSKLSSVLSDELGISDINDSNATYTVHDIIGVVQEMYMATGVPLPPDVVLMSTCQRILARERQPSEHGVPALCCVLRDVGLRERVRPRWLCSASEKPPIATAAATTAAVVNARTSSKAVSPPPRSTPSPLPSPQQAQPQLVSKPPARLSPLSHGSPPKSSAVPSQTPKQHTSPLPNESALKSSAVPMDPQQQQELHVVSVEPHIEKQLRRDLVEQPTRVRALVMLCMNY
eukprot:PhM_4_TR423/c4_g1_i3/m.71491